jgi:hypothetical protein
MPEDDESAFWREAGIKRGSLLWPAAERCEDQGKHALAALLREIGLRSPKPFVTGSQAYGKPGPDSDTDIAAFVKPHEYMYIVGEGQVSSYAENLCLHVGDYDILLFQELALFNSWRDVTDYLVKIAPVTKSTAIEAFKTVLEVAQYRNQPFAPAMTFPPFSPGTPTYTYTYTYSSSAGANRNTTFGGTGLKWAITTNST